ncbi:hypothetical protein HMPREF1531_00973 [Propionibacterium sp. oral taxon 192 str. F0372]|uniref:beta-ketoacyl-[acyl-carrier-protein] synthase family protein n=1 Tax=Propionibacterium sp. oral taxon 192 TaxID=671222 RepID=UPI000353D63C|nr:beta-ketoacyl-[acyl-carrier-protein] synthase family protein [Propionibacterium sp. oral taxon 192]EPH05544.1 hypothetical protein HMPREF1531_00973 [Propionibacterium sp. oral taxon 192 str. F0372]
MSQRQRVAVTGVGPVSAIGGGREDFGDAIREGRCGASPISAFDTTGFAHALACEVPQDTTDGPHGRASQFAVQAALLALSDAGLTPEWLRDRRVSVAVGTTDGESQLIDAISASYLTGTPVSVSDARAAHPLNLAMSIVDRLGLFDVETLTIATACSAGNYAIGNGFDAIASGAAEVALVGGADALCRKTFTGFYRLGTVAPDACRPFDKDRQGILTGEGAGMMVLERLEAAIERGAHIYCEVLGYGLTCDAKHPVAPDVKGITASIRKALRLADIDPGQVDLVSAHGTGTKANDVTECEALAAVFGDQLPPVTSVKSMIGHSMGAASALGAIASALALEDQFIPPTVNFRQGDPDCPVDCVPNTSRDAELTVVENHGFAFGGNNAVLLLERLP